MGARATWKGVLKVSLLTIPIKVFPATDSAEALAGHQLHAKCNTRIAQRRWCTTCAREVPFAELVKGFEIEAGRYVVLSEDELAAVRPESTKIIELQTFDVASALDSVAVDRSYYLAPNGSEGDAYAYAVLRAGLAGKVGIGKLAVYGREYLVAVRTSGKGLVLQTLHHDPEIRKLEELEGIAAIPAKVRAVDVSLAKQVIATLTGDLRLDAFTDDYRASLQAVIDAKVKGEQVVTPPPVEPPRVVNLADALRKSLHLVQGQKKPVKAGSKAFRRGPYAPFNGPKRQKRA